MKEIVKQNRAEAYESALIIGDLSKLTTDEKNAYYQKTCESLGLNPLTKPFAIIRFNGKEILYATKDCTEQLRKIHRVSLTITAKDKFDDVFVVTTVARLPDGREDSSTGAVDIRGLKGNDLANAIMKAETKSKRRVTLSICGLGILDESEIETIHGPKTVTEISDVTKKLTEAPKEAPKLEIAESETLELGDYVCQIGKKFKGKKIKDIDPNELVQYIEWVNGEKSSGKKLAPAVEDFAMMVTAYIHECLDKEGLQNGNP